MSSSGVVVSLIAVNLVSDEGGKKILIRCQFFCCAHRFSGDKQVSKIVKVEF